METFAFRNTVSFIKQTVTIITNLYRPTIQIKVNQDRC